MSFWSYNNSWFDDDAQNVRNQIDEFGESVVLTPMTTRPNHPSSPDPARELVTFFAVFEREGKKIKLGSEVIAVSSRDPRLMALVCDIPYTPKRGDRISHCLTGEVFEITDAVPDGLAAINIDVVQLGRRL
jgi:hypothetical protein